MAMKIIISLLVFLSLIAVVSAVALFGYNPPPTLVVTPTPAPTLAEVDAETLTRLVNDWRVENGLSRLVYDESLCEVAGIRLSEIRTDWSHDGFNTKVICTEFCYVGENLAKDFMEEEQVLQSWLDSPGHRKNLETNFTHMCIVEEDNFVVQIFKR